MMAYEYRFDVFALVTIVGLLVFYLLQRNYPTRAGRAFLQLLLCTMVSVASDLGSVFTISYAGEIPAWINYLVNILYLVSFNVAGVLFIRYILALINNLHFQTLLDHLSKAWIVFLVLFISTTPLTKLVFHFDNGTYEHGNGFVVLYGLSFVILIYGFSLIVRNRRILSVAQVESIAAYVILVIASVVFQMLYPYYLVTSLVSAVLLILIYGTLERPVDFRYGQTDCYNERAFLDTVTQRFLNNLMFSVVIVGIENHEYLKKAVSKEEWNQYMLLQSAMYHEWFGRKNVFALDGELMAVLTEDPEATIETIRSGYLTYSEEARQWGRTHTPFFWVVIVPDVVKNERDIKDALMFIREHESEGNALCSYELTAEHLHQKERDMTVLGAIRRALKNETLRVFYQPIFDLRTGRFATAEALLRLSDETIGSVPADEFIRVAEQYGCILEIDEYVLKNVARFIHDSDLRAHGVQSIHINLSGIRYVSKDFSDYIQRLLTEYQVPPDMVDLEVTERAEFSDESIVVNNMERLREMGVTFALDDFGTGYSNMTHLMSFPINVVKIDKSLLWQAEKDQNAMKMLEAFVKMIRDTGKKCVVEGVETEEMVDLLTRLNCDYLQGYFYSQALPEEEYIEFVKSRN